MKIKASLIIFALMVGMGTTAMADDHKEHNKKVMDYRLLVFRWFYHLPLSAWEVIFLYINYSGLLLLFYLIFSAILVFYSFLIEKKISY